MGQSLLQLVNERELLLLLLLLLLRSSRREGIASAWARLDGVVSPEGVEVQWDNMSLHHPTL